MNRVNQKRSTPYAPSRLEKVVYHRIDLRGHDGPTFGELEFEPVFHKEVALILQPTAGKVLCGILVDCPEMLNGSGYVVIDTDGGTVALESSGFRQLVIEHSPCNLEVIAVLLTDYSGKRWWDWEAYEISPYGGRILVSEVYEKGPPL